MEDLFKIKPLIWRRALSPPEEMEAVVPFGLYRASNTRWHARVNDAEAEDEESSGAANGIADAMARAEEHWGSLLTQCLERVSD